MATRQYNVARGKSQAKDVTEAVGSAISSGAVQVTIDLAQFKSDREVFACLEAVTKRIREGKFPPA